MKTEGYFKEYAIILICLLFTGCSDNVISEREVFSLLKEYHRYELESECGFTIQNFPGLYLKPEFSRLQGNYLCNLSIDIRKIHYSDEHRAVVEYRLVYSPEARNKRLLKEAWSKLKSRYRTLQPESIPDPFEGMVYIYTDPSDGDIFVRRSRDPDGFEHTAQWQRLTLVRDYINEILDRNKWYTGSMRAELLHNGDTWEVVDSDK